jgi:CubicO group peptidase (beta-lactamase class C family)
MRYCLLVALLPTACLFAQTSSSTEARIARVEGNLTSTLLIKGKSVKRYTLSQRMEHYHVHGLSVAVIDHYEVVWTKGHGLADVRAGRTVTAETIFQAGSISKPVAAMAAMKFVQDGRLSLDDDVNRRLKSWKVPNNEFTKDQKVTLRRLLSHSAGLTVHGFPGYAQGELVPTVEQVLDGVKPANTAPIRVDTSPGTLLRYSGGGYTVMQLLLTETAGEPFARVLKRTVLDPIGMHSSTYDQPLPSSWRERAAFGYRGDGSAVPGDYHTYPERAAAGLWTTAQDLAHISQE